MDLLRGVNVKYKQCKVGLMEVQAAQHQFQILQMVNSPQRDQSLIDQANKITELYSTLKSNISNTICALNILQNKILKEHLAVWQHEQRWPIDSTDSQTYLKDIQTWLQHLANILHCMRELVLQGAAMEQSHPYGWPALVCDKFAEFKNQLDGILGQLMQASFITENQPPQIIKTKTRISPHVVRHLIAGMFGNSSPLPVVQIGILSEEQANKLVSGVSAQDELTFSGSISVKSAGMEFDRIYKNLSATFQRTQVTEVSRGRGEAGTVTDGKFCFVYFTTFPAYDISFKVWEISSPFIVITHSDQEPTAWACITWDSAFATIDRLPFNVAAEGCWTQIGEMLSSKFSSYLGRGLTQENLQNLKAKALRSTGIEKGVISWSKFGKDQMPEGTFTFCQWMFAIMKLLKDHLQSHWENGRILGFISKSLAEHLLKECVPGTFLLRFSDSVLGAISVAWLREDGVVDHLSPFESKELLQKSLADHLSDLPQFVYLHPNYERKDVAFGLSVKPRPLPPVRKAPYVARKMVTVIEPQPIANGDAVEELPNLDDVDFSKF